MTFSQLMKSKWLLLILAFPTLGAAQWNAMAPGFNANKSIVVHDQEMFVASYLTGIKVSADNGLTWTDRNNGLPAPGGNIYTRSVGSDGSWMYAGTHEGIYRSSDAGATWLPASSTINISSTNYPDRFLTLGNMTLVIMSTDPFNGGGMYRTDNHGLTWNIGHSGMTGCGNIFNLTISKGILYASATGGLYRSDDLALSWTQISAFTFMYDYSISKNDDKFHVAAGQFGFSYSGDGGSTWQNANGPTGYSGVELRFFDGQFLAVVTGNDRGVWSSPNGENWTKMSGISAVDELSLEDTFQFGRMLYVGTLLNIYKLSGTGVSMAPRVFLGAAFDQNTGKMRDDLRDQGTIPLEEPYGSLGFILSGTGGNEVTFSQIMTASNSEAIVDWVLVELRDRNDPTIIIETQSALLQRDGDIVGQLGHGPLIFDVPLDDYFVAIRHREHLGVMTETAVGLSQLPKPLDFTSAFPTFGTQAQMNLIGTRMLWPGNVLNDGVLRFAGANNDRDPLLEKIGSTSSSATISGYHNEDINMDGVVSYDGPNNDREVLQNIIGYIPTRVILEQLP